MSDAEQLPGDTAIFPVARMLCAAATLTDMLIWRGLGVAQGLRARHPLLASWLRRAVLVMWWSVTLQLRTQFRFWLRARRLRRETSPTAMPSLITDVDASSIDIASAGQPVVSIIIPTYGQTAFTLRCLASIAAHPPAAPFEVIVVDDAFAGPETLCLRQVHGIQLLRNAINLGFLHSCNSAARRAGGEFLLFLNNDTQVQAGWADTMLTLFRTRADVGAVGSKLIYPNGSLQEAGGIIWNDGTGWNFGRGEEQNQPAYNYVREVDYCSGASLMVPRALFLRFGGFDGRYAPAYFEDTDLCFRLRSMGLKTLYQPRSIVVHHEGVSHGRDAAVGIKSCQTINRRSFVRTWSKELAQAHYPNGTHVLRAREVARHRNVALVIDHQVPEPDRDAGSRAILGVLRALLAENMVVKFWPQNMLYKSGYVEALQDMGIEVFHGPHQAPFAAWIRDNGAELDLVVLSRPEVAEEFQQMVRARSGARVLYYGHDLHFSRMRMQGTEARDERLLRAADRMEEREQAVWRDADAVAYLSEEEAAAVRSMAPDVTAHAVVPYAFDRFGDDREAPPGREIIFVAGFAHPPNENAACWFVEAVLPLVLARVPDASLSIVGSNPTARVRALAGSAVRVIQNVSDDELLQRYRRARVAAVPLRFGAGVKLKVVEALREGLPLVTTPVGAQGLPGIADIAFVRSDPSAFAAAVIVLLQDDALWRERCAGQIAYARERFSTAALQQSIMRAVGTLNTTRHSAQSGKDLRSPAEHRSVGAL